MGSSISITERTADHQYYTPEDILAVRSSLLTFVPLELADLILDKAKYWCRATWSFKPKHDILLDSKTNQGGNATACCLLTPKLCDLLYIYSDMDHGVGKIKGASFNIVSHDLMRYDQPLRDEKSFSGAYEGSYTWFEAVIVRDVVYHHAATGPSSVKLETEWIRQALNFRASDNEYFHCQVVTVKNPNDDLKNSDTWDIQRNKRATSGRESHLHTVVWTEEVEEDVDELTSMNETGRGLGREFVRSLMKDDRIAVMARAQSLSYNLLQSIELELYYSA